MKKLLCIVLTLAMVLSLTAWTAAEENVDPNADDYRYEVPAGNGYSLAWYYKEADFEDCHSAYTGKGGAVRVPDDPTTEIPKADKPYTIGFSMNCAEDEVGAAILENMKRYAAEAGVELLVNDANNDQDLQNQAVRQWIEDKVDGVIIAPCDFYGVKDALDACTEANIPVVTLNPAMEGTANAGVLSDHVEQGRMAGEMLLDYMKANHISASGIILISTLDSAHPYTAARAKGIHDAFKDCPYIQFKVLADDSAEDHAFLFESAIVTYGDSLLGCYGLNASATIGCMDGAREIGSDLPIISFDNDATTFKDIVDGRLLGAVCSSFTAPSFWCMSAMVNLLNGVEVPSIYWNANLKVTQDNVAEAFEHYYGQTLVDYLAGE